MHRAVTETDSTQIKFAMTLWIGILTD